MGLGVGEKVLVIGGSGFIGSAIVEKAISLGFDVDSLGLSLPQFEKRKKNVTYLTADITNSSTLKILSDKDYKYIVNTGGYIDHKLFFNGGDDVLDAHFNGLVNIVNAIKIKNLSRFVNIGSSDEYGDVHAPQAEFERERPITPYSLGKVAASHFLQMLHKTENFPGVTLRLFLCYGPGQDSKRFLPYLISQCLSDDEIRISPGEQLRDYCYIDDIVDAVFNVFLNDASNGKIFNIASGKPISIRRVVEKMVNIIGSGKPKFGAVPYRVGESMELYANIDLARHKLSWVPKTDLQEGLEKTINYYRNLRL
jgi:nucleoside-diphosphate-sugar epimerase